MALGLIAAGLGLAGSLIGSRSASKAAKQQRRAQEAAIATQQQYLGPYAEAGQNSLSGLQDFINQGVNFADTQAFKDIVNTQRAGGQMLSGNTLTGLTNYYANNFRPQQLKERSLLYRTGANAAGALASNISGLQQNIGTAQARGTMGQANALGSALGAIGSINFSDYLSQPSLAQHTTGAGPSYTGGYTGAPVPYTFPSVMPDWFSGGGNS